MKTRKFTSIVLTLCLLMSLVSVMFAGTASALNVDATTVGSVYETKLNLTFDTAYGGFAATGYADASHHKPASGGSVTLVANASTGPSAWFGTSNDVNANATFEDIKLSSTADNEGTGTEEALNSHFKLEPSTTYRITFKYRYRGNSAANSKISVLASTNPYIKDNKYAKRDSLLTGSGAAAKVIDGNDTQNTDTLSGTGTFTGDWKTETIIITTQPADKLTTPYLGIRANYNTTGTVAFQIDDFKVEKMTAETIFFDYKVDGNPIAVSDITTNHYLLAGSCGTKAFAPSIDAEGLHWQFNANNAPNYSTASWTHNAIVKEPDVNGGNAFTIESGKAYIVTAKFKVTDINGNGKLTIGIGSTAGTTTFAAGRADYTKNSTEFQYLTAVIDADSSAVHSGRNITLVARAHAGKVATVLVESVTVTVVAKDSSDVALVKTNSASPYAYDIEFVERGTEIDTPYTIVYNPTNGQNETAYNVSYVNPAVTTLRVDTDGDDYVYTPNGTATGNTYIDAYEDEERGTVVKISTSKGSGLSTSTFNFNEFKPEAGKKYYITFDAKLLENNNMKDGALGFERLYYSGASGISQSGNKTHINNSVNSKVTELTDITLTTEWKTYGWVLNAKEETGDTANRPYISFAVPHEGTDKGDDVSAGVFLVDNFKVVEYTTEGASTAPNNATDAMASIRGYGVAENGSYQSAGLRFRATVAADTKAAASEIGFIVAPAKAAKAAGAEWYAIDGELTAGVSALKQACYVKDSKDIVYSDLGDKGTAYQMILKGLSTEDGKTAFNQRFVAVMYITAEDGTVEYYNLGETSYNEMLTSYGIAGMEVPEV